MSSVFSARLRLSVFVHFDVVLFCVLSLGCYRAPLFVSAVFAVACGVRLSVTLVDCIQTAEDIVKLMCRPGSPITLVHKSKETPSMGAQNTRWWENFCDFLLKSPSISETVRDRPMVTTKH